MASKNVYKLYINIGEGGSGEVIAGGSASDSAKESAKKGAGLMTAYTTMQPYISATEQMIQNDVRTEYGNKELSARVGLGMKVANYAIKTAVGVASGMSLAQALGFGSGVGAVVGALTTMASFVTDIMVKQNEINNQAKIENEQLSILRGRAGIQFNRSRSGE